MRVECLADDEGLEAFLTAFEEHTLPKGEFSHAGHVTVAACYLFHSETDSVLPKMRAAIRGFNEAVGGVNTETAGYHETLTVFWLRVVEKLLRERVPASRLEAARVAVAELGASSGLHKEYYRGDLVADRVARREWRKPDLQEI